MKNYFIKSIKTYMDKNNVQLRTDYQKGIYSQEIKKYWDKHKDEFKAETVWTSNSIIASSVYKKMTGGSNKFWLNWLLEDYLRKETDIKKVLSICCGTGDHEIIMGTLKKDWSIDAFDISESSIRVAKEKARAKGIKNINFFVGDANSLTIDDDRSTYDLILSAGALHHIKELENLFLVLQKNLTLSGYFVINEFCGPSRFQWTDKQLSIVNRLLESMPTTLKIGNGVKITRPTIEAMIAGDPSEAIRSADIYSFIKKYFHIEREVHFGGTILHLLYPKLNHEFFKQKNDSADLIIKLLILIEDILIQESIIDSDFKFIIARKMKSSDGLPLSDVPNHRSVSSRSITSIA